MQQPPQTRSSEYADPHEQYNPVPAVLLGLVAGLIVWAVSYIVVSDPRGNAALGDRRTPAALAGAMDTAADAKVDGRQVFVAKCQSCHQATGQGLPGVFPPLAQSSWVQGPPEIPVQIVLHGLTGPIEVGAATFNGVMPAFGEQLSDAELSAVLTFVRSEWGNGGAPVSAEAVANARKSSAQRSAAWPGIQELQKFVAGAGTAQ